MVRQSAEWDEKMSSNRCNLCGQNQVRSLYRLPDWQAMHSGVFSTLVQCSNCGLIYQDPFPTQDQISKYYSETYGCYQPEMDPQRLSWLSRLGASYGMKKRSQLVLKEVKAGRLLDVGCATGVFLKEMQVYPDWELFGVELNQGAAAKAREKTMLDIFQGTLEEAHYPDNYFDVVTMWDVLEHLLDPSSSLQEIYRILKPGGFLLARVPNGSSWDARLFGQYWAGFEPPRHLFVFNPKTLQMMAKKNGFSVKKIGCQFGGYLTFLLSLQFVISGKHFSHYWGDKIIWFLQLPPFRLAAAPFFWVASQNLHGPLLNMAARK